MAEPKTACKESNTKDTHQAILLVYIGFALGLGAEDFDPWLASMTPIVVPILAARKTACKASDTEART